VFSNFVQNCGHLSSDVAIGCRPGPWSVAIHPCEDQLEVLVGKDMFTITANIATKARAIDCTECTATRLFHPITMAN
jgi:hypothetical protein